MNQKTTLIALGIVGLLIVGIFVYQIFPKTVIPSGDDDLTLRKFNSVSELKQFLKDNQIEGSNYGRGIDVMFSNGAESMKAGASAPTTDSSGSADDYSQTNIQVEGVDEADFVKNDGKYIYIADNGKVRIVEAYPASGMKILSEINVSSYNIFINGNKLIVFSSEYKESAYSCPAYDEAVDYNMGVRSPLYPCTRSSQFTTIYVYDVSDRTNPKLETNFSIEGDYVDSRMIGEHVYLISNKNVYSDYYEPPVYALNGVETKIAIDNVYYYPYQDNSYVFSTITALNLNNENVNTKVYLTGYSSEVYVSQNNIFMISTKYLNYYTKQKMIVDEVYMKVLPLSERIKVEGYNKKYDQTEWQYYGEIREIVYDYSESLTGTAKGNFDKSLMEEMQKFELKISKEYEKTIVRKIHIDKNDIEYDGSGEVPGHIVNQFSMDEFDGKFRIATTTGNTRGFNGQGNSLNHLYVLDGNLKIIGSVEDLASGERIYSARFMGERAYMVTFRQTDPLFVINLKNPSHPEVLGYLKVSGFSNYLHPYDENHLLGIGQETNEAGRVITMKVSIFDVSDVKNPIESAKYVFPQNYSHSESLYDHKAILFDKEKNLLVLPVSWYKYDGGAGRNNNYYGAYVFDVKVNSINLRGKIDHVPENNYTPTYGPASAEPIGAIRTDRYGNNWTKIRNSVEKYDQNWENKNGYYGEGYGYPKSSDYYVDQMVGGINYDPYEYSAYLYNIRRSLFMDNVLYTISDRVIKANDLTSLQKVGIVNLPYQEQIYRGGVYMNEAAPMVK